MDYQEPPKTLEEADRQVQPVVSYIAKGDVVTRATIESRFASILNDARQVETASLANGKISSQHHQKGDFGFNQHHEFTSMRIKMQGDDSEWVAYHLSPNSVRSQSWGVGKRWGSDPVKVGPITLEAGYTLGFVSGYAKIPIPAEGIDIRIGLLDTKIAGGNLSIGIEASAMPYVAWREEKGKAQDYTLGVVTTSPYLSLKYTFDGVSAPDPGRPLDQTAAFRAAWREMGEQAGSRQQNMDVIAERVFPPTFFKPR